MDTNAQVVMVLKLALNLAPPALYFVILGLVNSQSRPHVISSRSDWLALIVVFCPVLLYPALWLATGGHYMAGLIAVALAGLVVYLSLPRPQSGWVVYNCGRASLRRALLAALDHENIEFDVLGSQHIRLPEYDVELRLSGLPLLKNTTITVVSTRPAQCLIARIETALQSQLWGLEGAINPSGPALLIAGTSMLILPLLMMVRHIDAFVKVVSDLWPV